MLPFVQPSRRSFLVGAGRFAAFAGTTPLLPFARTQAAEASVRIPPSALRDLARMVSGGVLLPDDPYFGNYAQTNNLRFDQRPTAIALCSSVSDVQACIRWVKTVGARFAVRSGGHNYAGFSTTPGLLIDMTPMGAVTPLDGGDGLVKIQGGAINNNVYQWLEWMKRTITHGRCDTVGAAGFLLGGGIGFNMRLLGVGSDLMHSTSIVTADGELRENIKETGSDSDLFWACRGGAGGNFGISTDFVLKTIPADRVTYFSLTWEHDLEEVLHTLLTRLPAAPPEFGSKVSATLPARGSGTRKMTLSIIGQLHPCSTTLDDIFGDLLKSASQKTIKKDIPYWVAQGLLSEQTFPYYYREESSFMKAGNIDRAAVDAMFRHAREMPGTALANSFKFFQVGGQMNATAADATAFVHRGFDWLFSSECNWWTLKDPASLVAENLAWQDRFYAEVNQATKAVGAFQNFPDPSLKDWADAYYGANYARLRQVKTDYDHQQLFTYAQGIKPL